MMTMQSVAQYACGTRFGADAAVLGVTTDSRTTQPGELFVALRGEHFDGHDYVQSAEQKGAAGALVEHRGNVKLPQVVVDDSGHALCELARRWRAEFDLPMVAVTGSNGKTTVKELVGNMLNCQGNTLVSKGNFNNEIGLPLSLLRLRGEHCFAVVELGMNQIGEISKLSNITAPSVAIITNAAQAHLQFIKSVEQVAVEKGDIIDGLGANSTCVLNRDDSHFDYWSSRARGLAHTVISFGLSANADVHAHFELGQTSTHLDISTPAGSVQATLNLPGVHNVKNALAATSAAIALDIPLSAIQTGLERSSGVKGRLQMRRHLKNGTLVDDTYNANPASMEAAIEVLAAFPGDRRLVIGDMFELGDQQVEFHRQVGESARRRGIGRLYAIGALSAAAVEKFGIGAKHYTQHEHIVDDLLGQIDSNTVILVKGSRGMKMEQITDALCASESQLKGDARC